MKSRLGILLLFVVLLCISMSGVAMAQTAAGNSKPPSREQVVQLMSAMGVQQSIDDSLHQAQIRVKDAARESFVKQNPQASDEATQKKLEEIFDSTPFFKFADISEVIIPVYQKHLSAADVQAGIDFYSSPAGKRLLEQVPEILREANEQGGKLVQQKMEAYADELEHKLEAFQNQLHSQQNPAPQSDGGAGKAPEAKSPESKSPETKSK